MTGDCHVRICEGRGVQSPPATRLFRPVRWRTRWSLHLASSRARRVPGSGSQIAGTRSRRDSSAKTKASMRSVLQASGPRPFTFMASAISTCQPSISRLSWTNLAPFIDSMTAVTVLPPGSLATFRTSPRRPSRSGGTAIVATVEPSSSSRWTSRALRDRSSPACNVCSCLLLVMGFGDKTLSPEEAPLHGIPGSRSAADSPPTTSGPSRTPRRWSNGRWSGSWPGAWRGTLAET